MKKLVLIGAMAALAACNQNTAAPAAAASEAAPAAPAVKTMADWVGTYSYTDQNGDTGTSVMGTDGSYTDKSTDGKWTETGNWKVDPAGKICFDPTGDDPKQPVRCHTMGEPGADGVMTATEDGGQVVHVRKIA